MRKSHIPKKPLGSSLYIIKLHSISGISVPPVHQLSLQDFGQA